MDIKFAHEIKSDSLFTPEEIVNLLLKERRIKDSASFLNPPHPTTIKLTDFGFKKEIKKTIEILQHIKKNNETIVIYTDYDADGITGGTILWETLHLLGFHVMPYVPHRKLEGYGFSKKGIDTIKKQFSPALIISVDHGITAKEKITYAKSIGIPIIVTDHHLKPEKMPTDAVALFHIPELSGSGVAYVFAKELYEFFKNDSKHTQLLQSHFNLDYLALAAIGTVADLVPLIGPSRSIVKYGLSSFQKIKRVGINAIFEEAGITGKPITPYEIGFIIAPRINAIGRLAHALDALRLLCTNDHKKAHELAQKIGNLNTDRQNIVETSVKEATQMVNSSMKSSDQKILILISDTWHEGIIGLIASKITEAFFRPTIVITKADGFYKGSARSNAHFHITNFLRDLKKYLIDIGGHAGAAGFSINKNELNNFVIHAKKKAEKEISNKDLERVYEADLKIPISKLTVNLARVIETLEPFGIGNPKPVFLSEGILFDAKLIGKTKKHMKLYIKDLYIRRIFEFISFNSSEQFSSLSKEQKITMLFQLDINRWNGKENIVGRVSQIFTN